MQIAQKYQDRLPKIKSDIRQAHDYFNENYKRYNKFTRFVFESNLTSDEITLLETLQRPQIEFNILAARIARLRGEFYKHDPSVQVNARNQDEADWLTVKVVEQHLHHMLSDENNHNTKMQIITDLLAGGFSVAKIYTDYESPMSMDQIIKWDRCEPTLCVFDKLAKLSHKGDGRWCAELFPKDKEQFAEEYPDVSLSSVSFRRGFEGFNWSYKNDKSEYIIVADYYEKKRKEKTIVKVQDKGVMTIEKYRKMVDEWDDFTVPPQIIGNSRKTFLETICRYRLIENQLLEYEETDYDMLPLVFFRGVSNMIKTTENGNIREVILPYVYNAEGAQRLKNFAGIALANEIENQMQHKIMVAKEALPKEAIFREAYEDVQHASTLVYNSVHDDNPELPINNPIREVQRIPAPPEIIQAFTGADSLMEQILGSFDASLGINDNQLSGRAIIEGATQSNAAAMPYMIGFMEGLQRISECYVSLMPKYITTPRTLPIIDEDGKRRVVKINQEDGVSIDYDPNALNVVVQAGPSFQVQKTKTLMMVKEMMGMSPEFSQFIAAKGLNFVLDNMEGRGIEQLKDMVKGWQEEQEQMKQRAMQMQEQQAQQNPAVIKAQVDMQKLQMDAQKNEMEFKVDMAKLQNELMINEQTSGVQLVKALTERHKTNTELEIKHIDVRHRHNHDVAKLLHDMSKAQRQGERANG